MEQDFSTFESAEDGFRFALPDGWEVDRSEPAPGTAYYFVPVADAGGGFSVYCARGEGESADERLALERELAERVEIVDRREVDVGGRPALRIVYEVEEVEPRETRVDGAGRREEVGPTRRRLHADFTFVGAGDPSYVVGYKIEAGALERVGATLGRMVASFSPTGA